VNISVFGVGYVGLVQAAVLAEVGHNVVCTDVDGPRIEQLQRGKVNTYEPGLAELVRDNMAATRLVFTADPAVAVAHGRVQFIAVGTPPAPDGSADLGCVFTVAQTIARLRGDPVVIVEKSTVPVGTGDRLRAHITGLLEQTGKHLDFEIASNPEFLKEGSAVADSRRPDRIVVGTENPAVRDVLRELYAPFNRNHDRMMYMSLRSAELTKYAANCLLATKISFINQIAELAESLGADIEAVRLGIGADPRIGYHFLYAGCGYGGSCLPKDVRALIRSANASGCASDLLQAVEDINQRQKHKLFERIARHFRGDLNGRTFAVWGLAFKPNTDDMREAPSRTLMEDLWAAGARVRAFDPAAMMEVRSLYGEDDHLLLMSTPEAVLPGADALVICTEWQAFKAPDFDLIAGQLRQPVIFDGRNIYDPERLAKQGITYIGIGRGDAGVGKGSGGPVTKPGKSRSVSPSQPD
jgi:UDPglucose 6-dehydrogenase